MRRDVRENPRQPLPALHRRPYLEAVIDSSLWAAIIAPLVLPPLVMIGVAFEYYSVALQWPIIPYPRPMALPTLLLITTLVYHRQKRPRRKLLGLCVKCGYDLRASKDRCPECGLSFASEPLGKSD